jgi:hypothetical protein
MSVFRSKLARYGNCQQIMPVPIIPKSLVVVAPVPLYPLELPFRPTTAPLEPSIVPIEINTTGPQDYYLPGTIIIIESGVIPTGYLLCNGTEISRIQYSLLFNAIGTYYGDGDLTTTFNLPNLYNDSNPSLQYVIKF